MDQIIPLTNAPQQQFAIALAVNGTTLNLGFVISFNEMAQYWVLAIYNQQGVLLLDSVPLLTGGYPAANLLEQFGWLGIGSAYVINVAGSAKDIPDTTSLGTDFLLLWSDNQAYRESLVA